MAVCKYCGKEIKQSGAKGWFAQGSGWDCKCSPEKKHEMAAGNQMICKYCGKSVRTEGANGLFAQGSGFNCSSSPNKKHCLA